MTYNQNQNYNQNYNQNNGGYQQQGEYKGDRNQSATLILEGRVTQEPKVKPVGQTNVVEFQVVRNISVKGQQYGNFFTVTVWENHSYPFNFAKNFLHLGDEVIIIGDFTWTEDDNGRFFHNLKVTERLRRTKEGKRTEEMRANGTYGQPYQEDGNNQGGYQNNYNQQQGGYQQQNNQYSNNQQQQQQHPYNPNQYQQQNNPQLNTQQGGMPGAPQVQQQAPIAPGAPQVQQMMAPAPGAPNMPGMPQMPQMPGAPAQQ